MYPLMRQDSKCQWIRRGAGIRSAGNYGTHDRHLLRGKFSDPHGSSCCTVICQLNQMHILGTVRAIGPDVSAYAPCEFILDDLAASHLGLTPFQGPLQAPMGFPG
jgi:hypothetical protein